MNENKKRMEKIKNCIFCYLKVCYKTCVVSLKYFCFLLFGSIINFIFCSFPRRKRRWFLFRHFVFWCNIQKFVLALFLYFRLVVLLTIKSQNVTSQLVKYLLNHHNIVSFAPLGNGPLYWKINYICESFVVETTLCEIIGLCFFFLFTHFNNLLWKGSVYYAF